LLVALGRCAFRATRVSGVAPPKDSPTPGLSARRGGARTQRQSEPEGLAAFIHRRISEAPSPARLIVVVGAVTSVVAFAVTAALLKGGPSEVDLGIEGSVAEQQNSLLVLSMKALALASSARGSLLLVLAVGLFFVFRRGDWRPGLLVGTAFIGAQASTAVLKAVFHRPAPADWAEGDLSGSAFPSGHMAQAVAVWGAVAIVLAMGRSRRAQYLLTAGTLSMLGGVALSRLILQAHWLTDVIAGTAIGALWLAIIAMLTHVIRPDPDARSERLDGSSTQRLSWRRSSGSPTGSAPTGR
jgi:membrane-associated phospholipid phosphatase